MASSRPKRKTPDTPASVVDGDVEVVGKNARVDVEDSQQLKDPQPQQQNKENKQKAPRKQPAQKTQATQVMQNVPETVPATASLASVPTQIHSNTCSNTDNGNGGSCAYIDNMTHASSSSDHYPGPPPHDEARDFHDGRVIDWSGSEHFKEGDRVRVMSSPTLAGYVYRRLGRDGVHMCGVKYDLDGPGAHDWGDHAETDLILDDDEVKSSAHASLQTARIDERQKQLEVESLEKQLNDAKAARDFAHNILEQVRARRDATITTPYPFGNSDAARKFARAGTEVDAGKFARRYIFFRKFARRYILHPANPEADGHVAAAEAAIAAATDACAPPYVSGYSQSAQVAEQVRNILSAMCDLAAKTKFDIGSYDPPEDGPCTSPELDYLSDFVQKEALVQASIHFLRHARVLMADSIRAYDDTPRMQFHKSLTEWIDAEFKRR